MNPSARRLRRLAARLHRLREETLAAARAVLEPGADGLSKRSASRVAVADLLTANPDLGAELVPEFDLGDPVG